MPLTGLLAVGMQCKDRYCGQARLTLMGVTVNANTKEESGWISDNTGRRWLWNDKTDAFLADCPAGKVVSRVECRNKHCDDLRLECAVPVSWQVDNLGEPWVGKEWFSEEGDARQDCPTGFAMVGLECRKSKVWIVGGCFSKCGDYCDDKKLRCRQITPSAVGASNVGVALDSDITKATEASRDCGANCRAMAMAVGGVDAAEALSPLRGLIAAAALLTLLRVP